MRKGQSIIGKDVLSLEDGVKLETVSDVVIDPDGRLGFVVMVTEEGGFMSSSKVVPTDEVTSYGKDAVVIRSNTSVVSVANDAASLRAMVDRHDKIVGKKVFTDDWRPPGSGSATSISTSPAAMSWVTRCPAVFSGDAAKGTSYLATDEYHLHGTRCHLCPARDGGPIGRAGRWSP